VPSDIRWGITGPGFIAHVFAQAMAQVDDGELVAISSRSIERANEFADKFSIPRRYGSAADLAADADVDAVYVATPASSHEADTLLFLEHGKHVLCEKPLALNRQQVDRMTNEASARGLFLMEAIWSRFLPAYVLLAELLREGVIGEPLVVDADFGFRYAFEPTHRVRDRAQGGGALLDMGIYPVQLALLVLGEPDAVAAVAHVSETGVDDSVAAALRHPGGGVSVVKAAFTQTLSCTARIAGTDGAIELPPSMHSPDHLIVHTPGSPGQRHDRPIEGEGLHYQILEVHRCLHNELLESPTMPHTDSRRIASTLDAIRHEIGVTYPEEDEPIH
jgi:predicted dehydrogenase